MHRVAVSGRVCFVSRPARGGGERDGGAGPYGGAAGRVFRPAADRPLALLFVNMEFYLVTPIPVFRICNFPLFPPPRNGKDKCHRWLSRGPGMGNELGGGESGSLCLVGFGEIDFGNWVNY